MSRTHKRVVHKTNGPWTKLIWPKLTHGAPIPVQHDPDENWQAGEVAHQLVFGYGILTWEWIYAVRSYMHVLPFAALFRMLQAVGLDTPDVIAHTPRLFQAAVLAGSDIALGVLTERHICPGAGLDAILCSSTSWFIWYCGVRTYSSCAEAALVGAALTLAPPPSDTARVRLVSGRLLAASSVGALALAVRPTAAIILLPLFAAYAATCTRLAAATALAMALVACTVVAALTVVVDRLCYGRWLFAAARFVQFNLLTGGSAYYGTHPWHWYLSAALPAALGAHAPLVLLGLWRARGRWARAPAWAVATALGALSLAPHKELRFVLPLFHPLLLGYAGSALHAAPPSQRRWWIRGLIIFNALPIIYLSAWHQSAPIALMAEARAELGAGRLGHLDLLTRCHQTPAYVQLHAPIPLSMLPCPPPGLEVLPTPPSSAMLNAGFEHAVPSSVLRRRYPSSAPGCANECDCFLSAPGPAVAARYRQRWWHRPARPLPTHVALFDEMYAVPEVRATLERLGFAVHRAFFHELIWREGGHVAVRRLLLLRRL